MQLRPYQVDIIDRARHALAEHGSAVLQMPTGGGKTRVAAEIVSTAEGPVWFICHRQEIEKQAAAAFEAAGIDFGIVSPRGEPQYEKPVQIISVGTLASRMGDLPTPKLAIWDECHHVAAKSWAAIREQLESTTHLGLTATPERLDGKGLKDWFADIVIGPSTRELIDAGYLSEFRYFAPSDPDLAAAKLQAGDYRKKDAAAIMNTPVLIGDAIAEYKAKANGKRALVFAASVEASIAIVDRFSAEGVPAAHVDGTTPTDERDLSVQRLASGEIKVLSNVEVFTEGFDLPAIDAVILMRPTKSLALFLQMIGRALRTADGKDEALIFDHAGLWLDHGWFDAPLPWSIEGGARQKRINAMGEGRLRRCPKCKEVRLERVETCRCGYEFPTGREIGEYDGVLQELRGAVPEGCVTMRNFAGLVGRDHKSVKKWIARGMPHVGSFVVYDAAVKWVDENAPLQRGDGFSYVSARKLASLANVSKGFVRRLINDGSIPTNSGKPLLHEGLSAIESNMANYNNAYVLAQVMEPGLMNRTEFGNLVGVSATAVRKWINRGMPCRKSKIDVDSALHWLDKNRYYGPKKSTITDFASKLNVDIDVVKKMKRDGIPQTGRTIILDAGLEWVRDNTDIQIPPEAWPKQTGENDNRPDNQSEAA